MVAIAQLAEHRIVVPSVVGSSPTSHPKKTTNGRLFLYIVIRKNKTSSADVLFAYCTYIPFILLDDFHPVHWHRVAQYLMHIGYDTRP